MEKLTIALAKGRLADQALSLLSETGLDCSSVTQNSRQLVMYDQSGDYRFVFVKPSDVPTYVERGAADIGVVGKDTLLEEGKDIFEMLDLGFGKCKLAVAGYPEQKKTATRYNFVVATKYVNVTREYYAAKGINVDIVKLNGSIELAPIMEMSDVILDIVESGKTLQANGLVVLEDVAQISARLVVNKVSLKTKKQIILPLLERMKAVLKEDMQHD